MDSVPFIAMRDTDGVYANLPSLLWFLFTVTILLVLRKPLGIIIGAFVDRLRAGAAIKIGQFEIAGLALVRQSETAASAPESSAEGTAANPVERYYDRVKYFQDSRNLVLVHRLFRSRKPDQEYDVLIYLVPHGDGVLTEVKYVEYYFGPYWQNRIFTSEDRRRGFPVLTSAYGCFLCSAKLFYNDGASLVLYRYIDFEMGAYAPVVENVGE